MVYLILLRHGESQWNVENRFTGWVDVDITSKGEDEARKAGLALMDYPIDMLFTSALLRAIRTADIALQSAGKGMIPTQRSEKLNERHYGDLQGLNKDEVGKQFGTDQLKIWRRSYDTPPPNGESLKMTQERVLPYFHEQIIPVLKEGKNVLITAHGNSLRALIAELDNLSREEILELNIATGKPIVYTLDEQTMCILNKQQLLDS
ncbi:2,3-bisphosphoglycerate-dependent phosphoglycerate mutase [Chlorobiota bacterium]|nr:2,3-bisphosphoglycerate-dependent phosphoglycerate mutase [Chlorobiota bacterium]